MPPLLAGLDQRYSPADGTASPHLAKQRSSFVQSDGTRSLRSDRQADRNEERAAGEAHGAVVHLFVLVAQGQELAQRPEDLGSGPGGGAGGVDVPDGDYVVHRPEAA